MGSGGIGEVGGCFFLVDKLFKVNGSIEMVLKGKNDVEFR